jgi:hypothetical protein
VTLCGIDLSLNWEVERVDKHQLETNSENLAVICVGNLLERMLCTKIRFKILSWIRKIAAFSDMTFVLFIVDCM